MQAEQDLFRTRISNDFHTRLADHTAASAASFLPQLRRSFRDDHPQREQNDLYVYMEAVRGLDVFYYLEAYGAARKSGMDFAGAVEKAFLDPRMKSLNALKPDMSVYKTSCPELLEDYERFRTLYEDADNPATINYAVAGENIYALRFLAEHLERHQALGWGYKKAAHSMIKDLSAARSEGRMIEGLSPKREVTAEGITLKRAIDWLARQSNIALLLQRQIKFNKPDPDTPEFENQKAVFDASVYYISFCRIAQACMKNNLEKGTYVRSFAQAAHKEWNKPENELKKKNLTEPFRIHAHLGLYEYVKEMVLANVKIRLNGQGDSDTQAAFENATNYFLESFAKEFPIPKSEPRKRGVMLEIH
jgi:hypothetical protein